MIYIESNDKPWMTNILIADGDISWIKAVTFDLSELIELQAMIGRKIDELSMIDISRLKLENKFRSKYNRKLKCKRKAENYKYERKLRRALVKPNSPYYLEAKDKERIRILNDLLTYEIIPLDSQK